MFKKYWESGYQVMPILPNSKTAFIPNFDKWSKEKIEEAQIDEWEDSYEDYNMALVVGRASNIMVLDIDTLDPQLLKLIPPTPIIRKGRDDRAGAYFYKWTNKLQNRNFHGQLEFIVNNRYIMIPPSIHSLTKKPFLWATPDNLLSYDPNDLPVITVSEAKAIVEYCTLQSKKLKSEGNGIERNNSLKNQVCAAHFGGKSDLEIAEEIYDYDKLNHKPRLFTDAKEKFRARSEEEALDNSILFTQRIIKSLGSFEKPQIEVYSEEPEDLIIEDKVKDLPVPSAKGIKLLFDEINSVNHVKNPNYSLGAAYTIASTLLSGRFQTSYDYPSLISVLVGPSSSGKDSAMKAGNRIFMQDELLRKFNLYGPEDVSSAIASFRHFAWKRYQYWAIDEASSLFRNATKENSSLPEVIKEFIRLFSIADNFYDIREAVYRDDKTTGCYGPRVSVLFAIQTAAFIESQTKGLLDQGFLNRCLYFRGNSRPEINLEETAGGGKLTKSCEYINAWYTYHPLTNEPIGPSQDLANGLADKKSNPKIIAYTDEALKLRKSLRLHYHDVQHKLDISEVQKSLYSKASELIGRVALINCVMNQEPELIRRGQSFKLDVKYIEDAKNLFDANLEDVHSIVEQSTTTGNEKIFVKLKEFCKVQMRIPLSRLLHRLPGNNTEQKMKCLELAKKIGWLQISMGHSGKGTSVQFLNREFQ